MKRRCAGAEALEDGKRVKLDWRVLLWRWSKSYSYFSGVMTCDGRTKEAPEFLT